MTGIERLVDIVNDGPYSGGMIHISVHKLREICDQIEGEADVETVKSEAMAALNFVEEHGGLEKARRELERVETWHLDKLEMYRLCTKYGGVKRLKRHLMPEGLEWPIYDTGEPVGFGDEFLNARGGASVLRTVLIKDCRDSLGGDFYWKIGKGKNAVTLKNGERVKRPAPKVLDADGVEIRVGDTVWCLEGWYRYVVTKVCKGTDGKELVYAHYVDPDIITCDLNPTTYYLYPDQLTHRAPVRAADGKLLREGETVYDVNDAKGFPGIVKSTRLDRFGHVKVTCEEPTPATVYIHPCRLTHERPDSWERWEADLRRSEMCEEACDDLVRRAKALAERGA